MPQMMPLSWSLIFILILSSWIFILIIISFLKQQSPAIYKKTHNKLAFSMMW